MCSSDLAFWAPTGDYNRTGSRSARLLAKGFWSHMLTAGATWYPDQEKTWSLSALNRYEFHMENKDLDFTAGDTYTVEFGVGKSLNKFVDVGLAGYYQKQTTGYSPDGAGSMDHVVGLGPEISTFCPKLALFTSLRYLRELDAKDRPEGHTVSLTLTKRW